MNGLLPLSGSGKEVGQSAHDKFSLCTCGAFCCFPQVPEKLTIYPLLQVFFYHNIKYLNTCFIYVREACLSRSHLVIPLTDCKSSPSPDQITFRFTALNNHIFHTFPSFYFAGEKETFRYYFNSTLIGIRTIVLVTF